MQGFTELELSKNNLDKFFIRQAILKALNDNCSNFEGRFLDVGCGKMPYKNLIKNNSSIEEYIGLDIESALEYDSKVKPDFTWDGLKMPFENNNFDSCMATEVLEHCPDPKLVLKEISRVLKPNSPFFFTVPFLWNLHEIPYDEYRYTPFALERLLGQSGFVNIEVKATGGWHASMAQMLGLWLTRSKLSRRKKAILKRLLFPAYKWLLKIDEVPKDFNSPVMIPSLYGIAYVK